MVKHNNNRLKKTFAVVLMITAFVFFSINVYASTYNPTTYNSYTDAITYNGITYNVRVTQLKALSEGTSLLPGGMETIMLVSLQMTNNTNTVKAATIPKLSIDLSDERVITDVFTYGGDFTLGLISGGIGIFYPNSEFSLDNNKVIVPPSKSLYCVGAIGLPAQLNQSGDGTLDTGLRGVHLYDKSNYSVTDGNYSYGNPVDLSSVISAIEDLADTVATSDEMIDIIDLLIYSGSTNVNINTNLYNYSNTSATYNGVTIQVDRYIFNSYINYRDYELDPTNDTLIDNYDVVYPVLFKVRIDNPNTYEMLCNQQSISINGALPGVANYVLVHMYSNFAEIPWFHNNAPNTVQVIFDTVENGKGVLSPGSSFLYIYYERHVTGNSNPPTYESMSLAFRSFTQYQSDLSETSDDVASVTDSNHIIEESYYSANASAIEATGLSNYRFSNEQNNGIGQVSSDFMLLWNALGSWNGVYVFSLTMALATFIMRHRGMLPSRSKDDKGGEE